MEIFQGNDEKLLFVCDSFLDFDLDESDGIKSNDKFKLVEPFTFSFNYS